MTLRMMWTIRADRKRHAGKGARLRKYLPNAMKCALLQSRLTKKRMYLAYVEVGRVGDRK